MPFLTSCLPGTSGSHSQDPIKEKCVFCNVTSEKFNIVAQNERLIAFTDRSPAAKVHLLVIPRKHIPNVKSLSKGDERLVEEMHSFGTKAIDLYLSKLQDSTSTLTENSTSKINYGSLSSSSPLSSTSQVLKESSQQTESERRRFGFHIPPFRSVDHLHLHCLLLPFRSPIKALKYRVAKGDESKGYDKGWSWFVEWKQACKILEKGKEIQVGSC